MENLNLIKDKLKQYYGSDKMYTGLVKRSVYSDGMKALIDLAACYWLYDIIQTEVLDVLKKKNVPDTYYFTITSADTKCTLTLSDYNNEELWNREIGFTTFPDGTMNLHIGYGDHGPVTHGIGIITCLPSEN